MNSAVSHGALPATGQALAFSGTIAATKVSAAYRLGLVVVAATMLLLPVLYLALIVLTGASVWWHLTANAWILRGSGAQWRVLAYATPAVAGAVLVFFMVKPILARPSKRQDPLEIDESGEPALFALITEICRQVGARRPRRVQVDCAVNASAGFMHGPFSVFRRDLVLTIGLPLVAGLSARELAGVLAHEFGHFAQGGGLRLTGIVRGVNAWFGRVVYERDEWDVKLERWARDSDSRLGLVLFAARGAVWLSRKILGGLMMGGHAISCFMMRQMEYDADSYEIKVAGSQAFVRTMVRLRELGMGAHFAYHDVRQGLGHGALPAHWPSFMVERSRQMPEELLAHLRSTEDGKTGVFDTHPCDADRVRAAEAAAAEGVLVGADSRASQLFRDFDALSAAATRHHFEHDLGISLDDVTLVDTAVALRESENRRENFSASERFFGDGASLYRPLRLHVSEAEALETGALLARLAAARDAMANAADPASRYGEFNQLESKRQKAFAARALLAAGFASVSAEDFELAAGTADAAAKAEDEARNRQRTLASVLEAFEAAAADRLSCALALLRSSTGPSDESRNEMLSLVEALNALGEAIPGVHELRRLDIASQLVEANAESSPNGERAAAYARQLDRRFIDCRETVRRGLAAVACPARFTASPMTVAERCGMPPGGGPYETASEIVDRVLSLYSGILGRLAAVALQVEDSLPPRL